MKKLNLFFILIMILSVMAVKSVSAQTTFSFNQLQLQVIKTFNVVAIIPGQWTHGDWDDSHVVEIFVRGLGQLSTRLEGVEGMIDQFKENPEPSTEARILASLRVCAGQVQGLERMADQHLDNPVALDGVVSDLLEIKNLLDESIDLVMSDHKD